MIASLRGTVTYIHPPAKRGNFLVIEVNGVGYEVLVTASLGSQVKVGQTLWLHTHLQVWETSQELFGFSSREELEFFELLLGVKGIGARTVLHVMDAATPEQLRQAVATGDPDYLVQMAKIPPRVAGLVVAGLSGKLEGKGMPAGAGDDGAVEAREALIALGFPPASAEAALRQVARDGLTGGELIRAALKQLGAAPKKKERRK